MPMDLKSDGVTQVLGAYVLETVSAETLAFLTSAGAVDVGSAAGTVVYGKLAKAPVMNKIGDRVGEFNPADALASSLLFTTGVLDSTLQIGFVYRNNLDDRLTYTAAKVAAGANGTWALDYQTGLIVVKKKTTGTTQAITSYTVAAADTAASSGGTVNIGSYGGTATTLGQKLMASSIPITISSDQVPLRSATAIESTVGSSASNVTLLAANANRKNAAVFNDSTQILYLKLGATASATSYTVQLQAGGYYELPIGAVYTGIIDGIWASANGNARVTELT